MQYCLKVSSTAQNPAYSGVFARKFKLAFDRKPNQIPPLGIRVQPNLHAELCAISLAMDFIRHSKDTSFIIFSDSKSSLEALNGFTIELDLVLKIIKDYTSLGPVRALRP